MMDAKLAEECRHVNFHGSLAKPQAARDLFVGLALHDQVQDVSLTAGRRAVSSVAGAITIGFIGRVRRKKRRAALNGQPGRTRRCQEPKAGGSFGASWQVSNRYQATRPETIQPNDLSLLSGRIPHLS
jgi:hypothetical protein